MLRMLSQSKHNEEVSHFLASPLGRRANLLNLPRCLWELYSLSTNLLLAPRIFSKFAPLN